MNRFMADFKRARQIEEGLWGAILAHGVQALAVLRFGQWARARPRWARMILDPVYRILNVGVNIVWGIDISRQASIGAGLYVGHFGGIFISRHASLGRNCNISHDVTIGTSGDGAPTIGDDCYIAPGARLFGKITVGTGCKIGANAVVHKDLPDGAIVVLDPGFRILSCAGNRRSVPSVAA